MKNILIIAAAVFILSNPNTFAESAVNRTVCAQDSAVDKESFLKMFKQAEIEIYTRLEAFEVLEGKTTDACIDSLLKLNGIKADGEHKSTVDSCRASMHTYLRKSLSESREQIKTLAEIIAAAAENETPDETASEASDTLNTVYEERTEAVQDSLSNLLDEFSDKAEEWKDAEDEKPAWVTLSITSATHSESRLRDDGIKQFVAAPALSVRLPFGFSLGYSIGYYPDAAKKWDGSSVSLNYGASPYQYFALSAAYTRLLYSSGSKVRKASFSHSLDAGIVYDNGKMFYSGGCDFYIGKVKEPAAHITGGRRFYLAPESSSYELDLSPEILIIWGAQDPSITQEQKKKLKSLTEAIAILKSKKPPFGILGYEISLPIEFTIGRLSINPALNYIIPVNVADNSTASSYLNITVDMEYGIRF